MCFQHFTTFLCGCTRLQEQECDLVEQLDINFWRKIDCAYYHSEHVDEQVHCGAGRFYCSATKDGVCFDKIERAHEESKRRHVAVVNELAMRKRILLSKRDVWLAQGATIPQILALGEVKVLNSYLSIVDRQRQQCEHEILIWMKVKALAKQHHDTHQLHKREGRPEGPPFEQFLASFHPQVLARINAPSVPSGDGADAPHLPQPPLAVQPPNETLHQKPSLVRPAPVQQHLPQGPFQSVGAFHQINSAAQASLSQQTRAQAQQRAVQNAIPEMRAHQQKFARTKKRKMDPASSPGKSSSVVRRSSRVKDKQINYRDDDSDLSGSFSPIKAKSDSSGFSPGKTDPIDSPAHARAIGRKASGLLREHMISEPKLSLADKIGDWRRHDSAIFVPSGPFEDGLPQATAGLKRKAVDGGIALPAGTRLKQEWMADQRLSVDNAYGVRMQALPSQQVYGCFNPMMVPDFQTTSQIKHENSDTADPVKRFEAFVTPPHLNQGGPVESSMATPVQNISTAAPMWFNPLAAQMPDHPDNPVASPAEMSPEPMDDLAHLEDIAMAEQGDSERPVEEPFADIGEPRAAGPNSDENISSDDFDWTLLAQEDDCSRSA